MVVQVSFSVKNLVQTDHCTYSPNSQCWLWQLPVWLLFTYCRSADIPVDEDGADRLEEGPPNGSGPSGTRGVANEKLLRRLGGRRRRFHRRLGRRAGHVGLSGCCVPQSVMRVQWNLRLIWVSNSIRTNEWKLFLSFSRAASVDECRVCFVGIPASLCYET